MRMTTRNQRCVLCLVGLVALGSCKSGSAPSPSRLNLLLVTIDTLRADRLGCYGYSQIETPNLDKIARQGVLFENAVAPAPLTAPSHASMMTGVYPTAVSYTHLRAHETRHDLVCRLLLEKKK